MHGLVGILIENRRSLPTEATIPGIEGIKIL